MRRIIIAACIAGLLLLGAGGAWAEDNLLINGGFENAIDGWPLYWEEEMWLFDEGTSYLELREGGRDGTGLCVMVENVTNNDARFVQSVETKPGEIYHLSGWIKADGIDLARGGANLSVINCYEKFPNVYDTAGEWTYVECYFRTDEEQESVTIGARLGGYGADNIGMAWFDDLSLVAVKEVPPGYEIMQLRDTTNSQNYFQPEIIEEKGPASPLRFAALFLLLLPVLWILRIRGVPYPKAMVWVLLGMGLLVRLYLMATEPGYVTDMQCFFSWSLRMADVGPNGFYAANLFCDYPPGYLYLLWITGGILKLFGVAEMNAVGQIIVRLIPALCDLGAVYLLWKAGRRLLGDIGALVVSALYALSPAILINSAVWGQVDAVLALGLLCAVGLAAKRKWIFALPVFALTVLMKPQALMAAPIGVVALVADFVDGEDKKKTGLDVLYGLGASLGLAVVMLLPFLWGKENPVRWVIEHYTATLSSYPHATLNTANLFYLVGANWVNLDQVALAGVTYGTLGTTLTVLTVLGVMALYWYRRKDDMLPFFGALIFIGLYLLGIKMHERYLFPALLLLLYAYTRRRDWRFLALFCGYSITLFINCALVLRDTHLPLGMGFSGCALAVSNLLLLAMAVWVAVDKKTREMSVPQLSKGEPRDRAQALEGRTPPLFSLKGKDWALMMGLTVVYAIVAFTGLGSTVAPQTTWTSSNTNEEIVFDLGETSEFTMLYYGGITSYNFTVETSEEGLMWEEAMPAEMGFGECFRWKYLTPKIGENYHREPILSVGRYVRLAASGPSLALMEVAFRNMEGELLPVTILSHAGGREGYTRDAALLIDEQNTVPEQPSYFNSSYFDEIYHARTGYEHANQLHTYETTHPPLGKVFIMWGIQLFGMTPFGWRFMGALAGVLMVPAMYLLAKLLFKKTRYALLGGFMMAFDLMHLTQTRIATIDSFAVLFIILMYLCMFAYMKMSFFRDGWRTLIPLGLSGLFMGLGCASKWICIYAGVGLAVLFFWSLLQRLMEYRSAMDAGGEMAERVWKFPRYVLGTLLCCLVFFIIIPAAIYYVSYIPHYAYEGGLTWQRFVDGQVYMYSYHATLVDDHAFASPWYEWPLILKPMYYYNGSPYVGEGMISTIMCMGNPAVWWVGLASLLYMGWIWIRPHMRGEKAVDHRPAMLLVAFAAQYVPWMLVPRSMFIYHYFGSLPFVMMAIVFVFEKLYQARPRTAKGIQIGYMVAVALLFAAFYPVATGVQIPRAWADALNWFGGMRLPGWRYRGWLHY